VLSTGGTLINHPPAVIFVLKHHNQIQTAETTTTFVTEILITFEVIDKNALKIINYFNCVIELRSPTNRLKYNKLKTKRNNENEKLLQNNRITAT
jgi:hypothetical protein